MDYRRLGKAGIQVSELSFGSWITFGSNLDLEDVRKCLHLSFDHGVNFFDNAEVYAHGASELLMGEALREFRREEIVVSTKLFWGGKKPNQIGLSWKHILEGTKNSLRRLQCHRPDPNTPIEETVRAMDALIRSGLVFYWGTNDSIPIGSRLEKHPELSKELTPEKIQKVAALQTVSRDLNCTLAQLAIAWCLKNPQVSSVIVGASNIEQLRSNLVASEIKHRLVESVMREIEKIITNKDS
jgi:aryl-alcohol dehydrogenase-like predicted oxidoreductase